ncbi:MAG: hypothetical protein CM15mP21_4930 [Hyphomicrobiales bacterium]|nr:MAG: hypothetical protein CM15mP21_4930 [Hyphomicrobiales bacterium]
MVATVAVDDQANLVIIPTDALPPKAVRREKVIDETRRAFAVVLDGITSAGGCADGQRSCG